MSAQGLDARPNKLLIQGPKGAPCILRIEQFDEAGAVDPITDAVSIWIGGTADGEDMTGATECPATIVDGVGTVTIPAQAATVVARLTIDGDLNGLGMFFPSAAGSPDPDSSITIRRGERVIQLARAVPGPVDASDITSGTFDDARIPSTIARDTEVTAAVGAHSVASDPHGDRAAASSDATTKANAAQAAAVQRANHTGTQTMSTISNAATVATSGLLADVTGAPTLRVRELVDTRRALAMRDWYAALAARHTVRANVCVIGDSITEGQKVTVMLRRWVSRVADNLRRDLPTDGVTGGGIGFVGNSATGVGLFTWPVVNVGTPTVTFNDGPKRSTGAITAGMSITFTVTGTSVDIMYTQNSSFGTMAISVDGGGATTKATSGTLLAGRLHRVSLGVSGVHTVAISHSSGGDVRIEGLVVYNGDESAGIQVHDCGHGGYNTNDWLATPTVPERWPASIAALSPGLIIHAVGADDASDGMSKATYKAKVITHMAKVNAALTSPASWVLLSYPTRDSVVGSAVWQSFIDARYEIAATDSRVSVLDLTQRMPDIAGDTLGLYYDLVHPTDKGHSMIADAVSGFLLPR